MSLYQQLQQRAADNKPIRVALIGAGKFGAMYLAQVPRTPGVHLVGIADLSIERNRLLIDLTQQPSDLVEKFDEVIANSIITEPRRQVGIALIKFCNLFGLVRIEKSSSEYSPCFSSIYTGKLINGCDK